MWLIRFFLGVFLILWAVQILLNAGIIVFTVGVLITAGLLWRAHRVESNRVHR